MSAVFSTAERPQSGPEPARKILVIEDEPRNRRLLSLRHSDRLIAKLEEKNAEVLQATAELRQFREAMDQSGDGLFVIEPATGSFLDANRTAHERLGYTREELLALKVTDIEAVLPEDFHWQAHMQQTRVQGRATVNGRHRRKDGSTFPVEVRVRYVKAEPRHYMVAVVRDVSERERADEALRESEARFRQVADHISKVIWLTDYPKRRVLYINPAYECIWGRSCQSIYDDPASWIEAVHPDDRERIQHAAMLQQARGDYDEHYRIVRPDGSERWIHERAFPIRDEHGKAYRIAGFAADVSGQKRVELALCEAQQSLREENRCCEQRVAERTAELVAKNAELQRAMEAKDRFLANMSHELRTPLNAIIGFTGTLLMKLPGPLNAEQEEQLQIVRSSANHQLSLINDLLDLAKIDSGKTEVNPETISCREIANDTIATLRPLAQVKSLELRVQLPADDLKLRTDRRALRQILINLCNNAIKFTDTGTVTVAVAAAVQADGRPAVEISVTDTGIGIKPEYQDKLFQAFVQMDSTHREGTGLGLQLSRKLAQLLGGRIEFSSRLGHGSRFWLTLPLE